jgi:heat-inducible transcriptional repressor
MQVHRTHSHPEQRLLTQRETSILQAVVHLFILHGVPVGSRNVSKYLERSMPLSPATVRNSMMDLEELGYIMHPHTSAGRIPTDKGYRFYVDSLAPTPQQFNTSQLHVPEFSGVSRENIIKDASRVLSSLSRHLALVQIPQLRSSIVRRVELVRLSSERLIVVIDLDSDTVRTISLETTSPIDYDTIDSLSRFVNDKLVGRPLKMIDSVISDSVDQLTFADPSLLRLFIEQLSNITREHPSGSIHVSGTTNLIDQPESVSPERLRSVIELIENEDVIVHLLGSTSTIDGVSVRIGNEITDANLADYSLIATTYRAGNAQGSLGIIGPRRMDYGRMISIVQMMSSVLTNAFNSPTPDGLESRLLTPIRKL